MFELEQAILDWRKQMLAAGIKTPVPLDELEIHLREEIERRVKSGWNESDSFNFAIQKIGTAEIIQREFTKVETGNYKKLIRTTGLIAAWLAVGFLQFVGVMRFELCWNFFSFHPKLDFDTAINITILFAGTIGFWFLAKSSCDLASRIIAFLVCSFLTIIAAFNYYSDLHPKGIFGGGREALPFWFNGSVALL